MPRGQTGRATFDVKFFRSKSDIPLMISAWGHDDDVVDLTPDRDGQTVVDADGGGMAHGAPLV